MKEKKCFVDFEQLARFIATTAFVSFTAGFGIMYAIFKITIS